MTAVSVTKEAAVRSCSAENDPKKEEIMLSTDAGGIHDIVRNSKIVYPEKEKQEATEMGSSEAFQALLKKSQEDPEAFWNEVAQELHWFKPWEKTISGKLPDFEFFQGGISNPC